MPRKSRHTWPRPGDLLVAIALGMLTAGLVACGGGGDGEPGSQDGSANRSDPASQGDSGNRTDPEIQGDPDDPLAQLEAPEGLSGRWMMTRRERAARVLSPEQKATLEKLDSVGYVSGSTPASDLVGVTVFDRDRSQPGLNLYCSGHAAEAILMDMDGEELHRWAFPFERVWPGDPAIGKDNMTGFWRRVVPLPDGGLLAIFEGMGLIKLDKDSNLIWAKRNNAHHDMHVFSDGSMYVLTRTNHIVERIDPTEKVFEDFLVHLDHEGDELRRFSLIAALENSRHRAVFENRPRRVGDILHNNNVFYLNGLHPVDAEWNRHGNVVLSMRRLDLICVFDVRSQSVVAAWKGVWKQQHDPKLLGGGTLLLFDNMGNPGRSRVIEMDAVSGDLVWYYEGDAAAPFFTHTCGVAERMPNGNTLITESDNGRAFEVTPEREIVWEFHNPARAGEEDEYVATLFEVLRLPESYAEQVR